MTTWVFGYGSLVWRMDLPHVERRTGAVRGYVRRFFQLSPDHRGTPESPGRVVTVVPAEGQLLAGVAYGIADEQLAEVLAALDHRERAGYERIEVEVETADGALHGIMYVGRDGNPGYAPGTEEEIAAVVARASGPSGENLEYVERLSDALGELGVRDEHVDRITILARALRASASTMAASSTTAASATTASPR